ncbi:hypothetical protein B0I35DRAFT_42146 [Stachybotrys elegans]|uniref:Uncharacterized protein n=1 Tax=Stachybotrys elegans TaxID=80388 RepID=A0A8K0T354_9HYPO|nr:hypothetical protein B0I35DRAFT_42146 [Stachybotrys elegans]
MRVYSLRIHALAALALPKDMASNLETRVYCPSTIISAETPTSQATFYYRSSRQFEGNSSKAGKFNLQDNILRGSSPPSNTAKAPFIPYACTIQSPRFIPLYRREGQGRRRVLPAQCSIDATGSSLTEETLTSAV